MPENHNSLGLTDLRRKSDKCAVELERMDDGGGADARHRLLALSALACCVPIIFPTAHMLIFDRLWSHLNVKVDREKCTCSCWDTVFKGPYEAGVARYKHVYFNSTWNTFQMWTITVIATVLMYECFKSLFQLVWSRKLRVTMGILFLTSLHSHYYAWWAHWNYLNDEFYSMWNHQVFYTVTELISSTLVVLNLDSRKPLAPLPLLLIGSISLFHIISGGWDQFVFNVIQQKGQMHQILRDIPLMSVDLLQAGIALLELHRCARNKGITVTGILSQRNHVMAVAGAMLLMYITVAFFL